MKRSLLVVGLFLSQVHLIYPQALENYRPSACWKFQTSGPIRSAAVVQGDQIYFTNSAGIVYALSQSTGKMLWQFQTDGTVVSSPAVSKTAIYVVDRSQQVYSLDIKNGSLNWKILMAPTLEDIIGGWKYFMAAPVVSEGHLFVGSGDGKLYALDLKNGNVVWEYATTNRIRATPLLHKDILYQPSNDGYLHVVDAKNGKLLWEFATDGASMDSSNQGRIKRGIYDQPEIKDEIVVFGSRDGNTYAVDLATKKVKWKFSYGPTWAMATAIYDQTVYVGWSTNNVLCAIDLDSGKEIWQFRSASHNYSKPLVLHESVYFGSADGHFYKLNKDTGKKIWSYEVGGEIYSSPVYDKGIFYFGSDDGALYAVKENQPPHKAVYLPDSIRGNTQYLVTDARVAPYLLDKGYKKLDSAGLYQFVVDRIKDGEPSVVVFALPIIPENIVGGSPEVGMMRQYLNSGGKVVWMGDVPNYYALDEYGQFKRDPQAGSKMLGVTYSNSYESGNYYSRATQEGRNWGIPEWLKATGTIVALSEGIESLAFDEFQRPIIWVKKFHSRAGSGFVSCRSWAWNVGIKQKDLELIDKLATYGLE